MGKYFTVEVKPTIPNVAAGQHAAFANGDVLFDWMAFEIPKGAAKLIGVTAEIRPKGDAGSTVNKFAFELVFAKSKSLVAPTTLGTVNSAPAASAILDGQADRIIGHLSIADGHFNSDMDQLAIATAAATEGMVLEGEPFSGNTVGTDTLYVGGIAGDAFNFVSGCTINNGDLNGPVLTVADVDPRLFLAVGDTIAVTTTANTSVAKSMGVIKSMADANTITLESAFTTGDVTNDDFVYNVSPIRLVLTFEK
jgi:hypothetical protein